MSLFSKTTLILSLWGLFFGFYGERGFAAAGDSRPKKEIPGVETKVKQVPGENSLRIPQWKNIWEKARQLVLQKKYPEAVDNYKQALVLKPNLDEARLELVQVLITLERWGDAIAELETIGEHQPQNQKVQKELADLLSGKKEYRRANEHYQWLLQKDPDNIQIRLSLASNYYQINEQEKALIEWRQVLIRDPQNVEARTHLAEVLGATRRLDESILLLEGLVKQFPKNFGLKKKLAQTLVSARRDKEALPYLQELNKQEPGEPEIQLLLAQVLSAGKQYDQSLTYLEAYLKKKPDQTSALLEKARALFFTGNSAQALELYERIRKLEPDNVDLQREIAEAYYSSGNNQEALSEYEKLAKKFPNEYPIQEKIGDLYFQIKNYSQAIPPYQKALSLEPENYAAQLNLARAYNLAGEKEKALPLYRLILSKRKDRKVQVELADLLWDSHQYQEAFTIFEQILKEQPELWEVRLKLATGLFLQEEFGLASRQLAILTQERPDQAGIWSLAGQNALKQGDYSEAQRAFQKVLTLGEDQVNTLLRLGEIARLQGRPWKGNSYLDWALTIKPDDQDLLVEKAMALIDGGAFSQAQKSLEHILQKNPNRFKPQRAWAWLLATLDRREECENAWGNLEKNFPQEQDKIFMDQADFYLRQKKPDVALTALLAARIKNPKNLEIQRRIGRLLIQMGRWKEAESFFRELEQKKILPKETYLAQAQEMIREGKEDSAKELLWKALILAPDSIKIRFWLWQVLRKGELKPETLQKIEEDLVQFAHKQEGGILELAECFQTIGNREKAYALYLELIKKGEEDDDILEAVSRIPDTVPAKQKPEILQEMLEDLQKRFPRNQMITRQLIAQYTLGKEYGLAVKAIDGLLRVEDPLDPVLVLKKARLLERWKKHWDSQATYQTLLDPLVDSLFREKLALLFNNDQTLESFYKQVAGPEKPTIVNKWYEETKRKFEFLDLDPNLKIELKNILEEFKIKAIIQEKVFLEKEGKYYIWRGQYSQALPFLELLREIDPDNEEVGPNLDQSYRSQN